MNEDGVKVIGMSSEECGKYIRRKLDDPDWRHLRRFAQHLPSVTRVGSWKEIVEDLLPA